MAALRHRVLLAVPALHVHRLDVSRRLRARRLLHAATGRTRRAIHDVADPDLFPRPLVVSLIPTFGGSPACRIRVGALALGSMFLYRSARLVSVRSNASARGLLFASVVYLPAVLVRRGNPQHPALDSSLEDGVVRAMHPRSTQSLAASAISPALRVWQPFQIEPEPFNVKRRALIRLSTSCMKRLQQAARGVNGFLVHRRYDGGPTLAHASHARRRQRSTQSTTSAEKEQHDDDDDPDRWPDEENP